MPRIPSHRLRDLVGRLRMPARARAERRRDRSGPPPADPGAERVVAEGLSWLGRAQDASATRDGGVARDFSLLGGWASSYPETTGYIVPTLLEHARGERAAEGRERARRMLLWLRSIQLDCGAFQGGRVDQQPVVPVVFNTGQILLGLAAGAGVFGDFHEEMARAADWLVAVQDPDGCWRSHSSPFARRGEKTYDTHVAWGLFEAARLEPSRPWGEAGLRNVRWALRHQHDNGWFDRCCLDDATRPLTHTLGYALRGVVEAYRLSRDRDLLGAATRTADGLLAALGSDGRLPGRLRADWSPGADWVCLTGAAQVAHCWLLLYRETGHAAYRDAAARANRWVRRTVLVDGPDETRGAVKGSFPVDGGYCPYQYPNWAAKFCIDANALELAVPARDECGAAAERG